MLCLQLKFGMSSIKNAMSSIKNVFN